MFIYSITIRKTPRNVRNGIINKVMVCALGLVFSSSALALSKKQENACAIWLCAPSGFGIGCAAAFSEMKSRIRHFKPPLPELSSCGKTNGSSKWTHRYDDAALMPAYSTCSKFHENSGSCIGKVEHYPQRYIKNTPCVKRGGSDGDWSPQGCIRSYKYIEVFENGVQHGETFFW
jgi:hypothetical protein